MNKTDFINNLNEDLKREYAALMQYVQHAASLSGVYFAFVQELYTHASDEFGHAKQLGELITLLGGAPVAISGPTYTASLPVGMLNQDLMAEADARGRYKVRIAEARALGEFGAEAVLLGILKDEDNHYNDLESILCG